MARVILLEEGEDVIIGGSNVEVIGTTAGGETITIVAGNVVLNSSFTTGGDTIRLPGDAEDYTVRSEGARIIFENPTAGTTVTIPTSDLANTVSFSNGDDARTLVFDSADGRFELDGVAIGTTPAPLSGPTSDADLNTFLMSMDGGMGGLDVVGDVGSGTGGSPAGGGGIGPISLPIAIDLPTLGGELS
ncbi:hypothetical protein WJT74_08950 [Sphingomicrobium sp. XHP0239]|uniref:hypothetical protein n=1 Tax=Sphingomicrobium maritimum TaxID=3133972 RepID=UPI0031CC46E4